MAKLITITRELARAAAWDAGNRNMRKHKREIWNQQDWNAACREFARLTRGCLTGAEAEAQGRAAYEATR
jgi:hypothetical protein